MDNFIHNIFTQEISPADYKKLSEAIYDYCGINLPEGKRNLVEGRIRKRIRILGLDSFESYVKYLFSNEGLEKEFTSLINVVTTNKTDFFRENAHFEFMASTALPELANNHYANCNLGGINVWSAGCSTGEEPYTIAMVLNEYAEKNRGFKFAVYASDISTEVLKMASHGVYEYEKIEVISDELKRKYLLRSKNPEKQLYKIVPEIRSLVKFAKINFMDNKYELPVLMDIIFCRNVIIYFDKPTQERVIKKLTDNINKGGYLFLGHSETTMGMKLPLERVASTIYKKI